MELHTILGAGGAISNQLLPVLLENKEQVRLVSRQPAPNSHAEVVSADITDYPQTLRAIQGSSVVYLLAGLKYDIRVWQESWPKIMSNVINACKATESKLIFFDNVYMYGRVDGIMTEKTPFNPVSRKGEVRAAIASQLLHEMNTGNLQALIARAADFYGPGADKTGVPNMLVFANLKKGKKAQWLGNANVPHSFTYIPDTGKALYLLANRDNAFGQTWHLPTAANPLTGKQFVQQAAAAMQKNASVSVIPSWMMQLGGLFNRNIAELVEMNYQSAYPYLFDSSKFNAEFGFIPTSYAEGIRATADVYR